MSFSTKSAHFDQCCAVHEWQLRRLSSLLGRSFSLLLLEPQVVRDSRLSDSMQEGKMLVIRIAQIHQPRALIGSMPSRAELVDCAAAHGKQTVLKLSGLDPK
jgi:hypothetical protein